MAGRYFGIPFATAGDKITVPDATQPDGSVSFQIGFGFDYERANTDPDYKPVPRDGMNGLFHDITEAMGIMQAQGSADWTSDAAPYANGVSVYHNGKTWVSTSATNNDEPGVGPNWREDRLATESEMATGTSQSLAPSVAAVMALFDKRGFAQNDFIRIPDVDGGLIIQWWRTAGNLPAGVYTTVPIPTPFPNFKIGAVVTAYGTTTDAGSFKVRDDAALDSVGIYATLANGAFIIALGR